MKLSLLIIINCSFSLINGSNFLPNAPIHVPRIGRRSDGTQGQIDAIRTSKSLYYQLPRNYPRVGRRDPSVAQSGAPNGLGNSEEAFQEQTHNPEATKPYKQIDVDYDSVSSKSVLPGGQSEDTLSIGYENVNEINQRQSIHQYDDSSALLNDEEQFNLMNSLRDSLPSEGRYLRRFRCGHECRRALCGTVAAHLELFINTIAQQLSQIIHLQPDLLY